MTDRDLCNDTDFLYARPSFVEGFARILDLGGSFNVYNVSRTPSEADARAIAHDWLAIGKDVAASLVRLRRESSK